MWKTPGIFCPNLPTHIHREICKSNCYDSAQNRSWCSGYYSFFLCPTQQRPSSYFPQKSFSSLSTANIKYPSNFITVGSSVFTSSLTGLNCRGSRALNTMSRNVNDLPAANGPCCNETGKILTDSLHTSYCSHFRHTDFSLSPFISPKPWPGIMNAAVTRRCETLNSLTVANTVIVDVGTIYTWI